MRTTLMPLIVISIEISSPPLECAHKMFTFLFLILILLASTRDKSNLLIRTTLLFVKLLKASAKVVMPALISDSKSTLTNLTAAGMLIFYFGRGIHFCLALQKMGTSSRVYYAVNAIDAQGAIKYLHDIIFNRDPATFKTQATRG